MNFLLLKTQKNTGNCPLWIEEQEASFASDVIPLQIHSFHEIIGGGLLQAFYIELLVIKVFDQCSNKNKALIPKIP